MNRDVLSYLTSWKNKKNRKPLVLRGARQVGKSYLVRMFAEQQGLDLFEINFEIHDRYLACFDSKDVSRIINLLEVQSSQKIKAGSTLLFLDEIQTAPQVLSILRYFYEKRPDLHVIAAGSLLDFALEDHNFSIPVGRIEYLHLGPMTFKEVLSGLGKAHLREFLENFSVNHEMPEAIHQEFMRLFRLYLALGGMPESVQSYCDTQSLLEVEAVMQSILLTYRDDFNKYGKRVNHNKLRKVFQKLPLLAGQKLKYVNIDRNEKSSELKKILHMLELARVYYPVYHTAAHGIPLRAQCNEKLQKPLFLDVGLLVRGCGLSYAEIEAAEEVTMINAWSVCEQFIGQHLLYRGASFEEPEVFYWCREKRQASSEIDYVISLGTQIIPIEVKAGKTGKLKSLNVFLKEKGLDFGVRFNGDLPAYHQAEYSLPGESGTFQLLSLPLYMVEEVTRLVGDCYTMER